MEQDGLGIFISRALYRLWRCKRLLVLVPVILTLAAIFAGQIGGLSSYYFEWEEILMTGAIALVGTAIAVILLPAAPLEVLFGGVAAALLVATEPWQGLLFQPAHKGGEFTPLWLRAVIFAGAWIVLFVIIYAVASAIARLNPRTRPLRYRIFARGMDAATLRAVFALRPNSTSGPVTYGSRSWDGTVPARMYLRAPDPEHFDLSDVTYDFTVRDLGAARDSDLFEIDDGNGEAKRAVRYTYRDVPNGAWVMVEERPGPPAPLAGLSLRLNEGGHDLLRARLDYHLDRRSPAIILRPMRSFLCMLAWLTHVPGPKKPQQPAE